MGLGTFVRKPKLDLQVKLTSYSEEMQRRGMVPAAKVLSFEQISASAFLARELQLEEGTPLVRFRRLLLADNEPMSVDENFIPAHRVPGLLDGEPPTSLYNVLSERYGLVMEWGEDMIEATAASPSTARLLNVEVRNSVAEDPAPRVRGPRHGGLLRVLLPGRPLQALGAPAAPRRPAHPQLRLGVPPVAVVRSCSGCRGRPVPKGTGLPLFAWCCLVAQRLLRLCRFDRLVRRRGDRERPPALPEWPGNPVLEEPAGQLRAEVFLAAYDAVVVRHRGQRGRRLEADQLVRACIRPAGREPR